MRFILGTLFCMIVRLVMSLRYSVTIKGKENLKNFNKDAGILFLPNHPAHIDPILISLYFWPRFKLRPVVVEYIFRQPGINLIMKFVRAFSMPNFDTSLNEIKLKKAKETIEAMINGLKNKDNILIYPSGRLKHTGKEILGGASATHTILKSVPNANIVLARTTGLWGSSFSRSYLGKSPDFGSMVLRGIKCTLKAFILFLPRRKVLIEIEKAPEDFPRDGSRIEINRYLENWYNRYPTKDGIKDVEPAYQVSYSPFRREFLKLPKDFKAKSDVRREFSSEIEQTVFAELSKISKMNENSITLNLNLASDMGLDSLDISEVITFLGVNFDVSGVHPEDIQTVMDVLEFADGSKKVEKKKELIETVEFKWPEEKERPEPKVADGKIIPEVFFNSCNRMKDLYAAADDITGPLTYKKLKISALALAQEIKEYPSKHVAILLPASLGAYLVIIATLIANKIPVMLNWTLGPRYLNHMMQVTHSDVVISSWKFLEKLSNVEFGHLTQKIHFLEDIKKRVSKKTKLIAFLQSLRSTKRLLRSLKLNKISENETAVVLFTSGTEAAPKGVPLSHKNILSNLRVSLEDAKLLKTDIFYGILPPFHSFGFAVAGLFPILAGFKIAFFPDPTDSYSVAEGIVRWKITLLCTAPSFLKGILQGASKEQLKTMRLFITGAEKTHKEIFEKIKALGEDKILFEGYGITECSPVIALNQSNGKIKGVGRPLSNIKIKIINPETNKEIDKSKEGEICVNGPSVFDGYINNERHPFIELSHERYYKTGDLGYFDKDGNLQLSGRLKRFTKVAGEMVSLGAIEEVIVDEIHRRGVSQDGPVAAICYKEFEGKRPSLILFTISSIDKNEANNILKEAGFSNLVKITEVEKIDNIPLMGTGKIDYRFLQSMIE